MKVVGVTDDQAGKGPAGADLPGLQGSGFDGHGAAGLPGSDGVKTVFKGGEERKSAALVEIGGEVLEKAVPQARSDWGWYFTRSLKSSQGAPYVEFLFYA
jgi:hypothetical protein